MRPYYEDGSVTIYHGDCREILPDLEADAVVTDPPYGVGKAHWDDWFALAWMSDAALAAPVFALMPGIANIGRCPHEIGRLSYRWTLAAHLTNGMTRGVVGFGNWIACLLYTTDGVSLYAQDGDIRRFVVGTADKPDHPSPKPLDVMRWFVSRVPGDSILDPFMGSGTTLRAAKDLGRHAVGIEIEERYCEIAARRCAQDVLNFAA